MARHTLPTGAHAGPHHLDIWVCLDTPQVVNVLATLLKPTPAERAALCSIPPPESDS